MRLIADHVRDLKFAAAFRSFERYQRIDTFIYIGSKSHKAYSPVFNPSWVDAAKQKCKDVLISACLLTKIHQI